MRKAVAIILVLIAVAVVVSIVQNTISGDAVFEVYEFGSEESLIINDDIADLARSISTEEECIANGGNMEWVQSFFPSCVIPYPDGGLSCGTSYECMGKCIATDFATLDSGIGMCKVDTDYSGCYAEIGDEEIRCLNDDIMTMCTRDSTDSACTGLN